MVNRRDRSRKWRRVWAVGRKCAASALRRGLPMVPSQPVPAKSHCHRRDKLHGAISRISFQGRSVRGAGSNLRPYRDRCRAGRGSARPLSGQHRTWLANAGRRGAFLGRKAAHRGFADVWMVSAQGQHSIAIRPASVIVKSMAHSRTCDRRARNHSRTCDRRARNKNSSDGLS